MLPIKGLNDFETAEVIKSGMSVEFGETTWNICCVELFQLLLFLFIGNSWNSANFWFAMGTRIISITAISQIILYVLIYFLKRFGSVRFFLKKLLLFFSKDAFNLSDRFI